MGTGWCSLPYPIQRRHAASMTSAHISKQIPAGVGYTKKKMPTDLFYQSLCKFFADPELSHNSPQQISLRRLFGLPKI